MWTDDKSRRIGSGRRGLRDHEGHGLAGPQDLPPGQWLVEAAGALPHDRQVCRDQDRDDARDGQRLSRVDPFDERMGRQGEDRTTVKQAADIDIGGESRGAGQLGAAVQPRQGTPDRAGQWVHLTSSGRPDAWVEPRIGESNDGHQGEVATDDEDERHGRDRRRRHEVRSGVRSDGRPRAGLELIGTRQDRRDSVRRQAPTAAWIDRLVEMGESRTPRPEPFAGNHYERVRWFVVDRPNGHRHSAGRSSHVPLDRA